MAELGPFEAAPRLAVAVSGGADSLALTLLAHDWAAERGGSVLALTVDHRLRPDSSAEAAAVGRRLAVLGISHRILVRRGDIPAADLQAEARRARYALLGEACAAEGILHLLLGHHREDQAETLLLRLAAGSGPAGLAGMAPIRPTAWGRLLRPLLNVPRAALEALPASRGLDWVNDPSNRNPAFARVRIRRLLAPLAAEGLSAERLAAAAAGLGTMRDAVEAAAADAALRYVRLHPAGFARLHSAALAALPEAVGLRLLERLLLAVGGEEYGPRRERLERLHDLLCGGLPSARTLAGCAVVPQGEGGEVVICREAARQAPPVPLVPGARLRWDNRFEAAVAADAPAGLTLGPLGPQGWRKAIALMAPARPEKIPACARAALPALYGDGGIFAVPHLGYNREGGERVLVRLRAAPAHPLTVSACAGGIRHYL